MLKEAIRLYTGFDASSFPLRDAERVRAVLPSPQAEAALSQINALLAELEALKPDWQSHTLSTATQWARQHMAQNHPELDSGSLAALAWSFNYLWK